MTAFIAYGYKVKEIEGNRWLLMRGKQSIGLMFGGRRWTIGKLVDGEPIQMLEGEYSSPFDAIQEFAEAMRDE